jgi:hypothetical protein
MCRLCEVWIRLSGLILSGQNQTCTAYPMRWNFLTAGFWICDNWTHTVTVESQDRRTKTLLGPTIFWKFNNGHYCNVYLKLTFKKIFRYKTVLFIQHVTFHALVSRWLLVASTPTACLQSVNQAYGNELKSNTLNVLRMTLLLVYSPAALGWDRPSSTDVQNSSSDVKLQTQVFCGTVCSTKLRSFRYTLWALTA